MSPHHTQQCQRADVLPPPVRFVPGIGCTDQEEARNERETSTGSRVRCCGAPYMGEPPSRQPGFCNNVADRRPARSGRRYASFAATLNSEKAYDFKKLARRD